MMYANCLDAIDDDPNKPFERKYYYIQDGLYNVRALISAKEWVVEEENSYDVYGKAVTYLSGDFDRDGSLSAGDVSVYNNSSGLSECDPNFDWRCDVDYSGLVDSTDCNALIRNWGKGAASNQQSLFTNPYYFTGRRIDLFDNGNLKLPYYRNRYCNYSMGRFLTADPLGINPSGEIKNLFSILNQYRDSMSLYEYVESNPVIKVDAFGLKGKKVCCKIEESYQIWDPTAPVTRTKCTQRTINNPKGFSHQKACYCEYRDNKKINAYDSHDGECCWCRIYILREPMTIYGITLDAHRSINVKCEQGRGNWNAFVSGGGAEGPWLRGIEVPVQVGSHLLKAKIINYKGRISCDAAAKWKSKLTGMRWWYQVPLHDCWTFARETSRDMLKTCP